MSPAARLSALVVAALALLLVGRQALPLPIGVAEREDGGATYRLDATSAERAGARQLDAATRAATFTWAASMPAQHRGLFAASIAAARPEAQRLIALVDGLVTVASGVPPVPEAIGLTRFDGERYEVVVDLDGVGARHGLRGVHALVLHELGHVVDRALVPDDLVAALDAEIPTGERCRPGQPTGACATVAERFADTFAKWAMDDLGVHATVGYRILPPVPLARWGRPLARLGAAAPPPLDASRSSTSALRDRSRVAARASSTRRVAPGTSRI